MQPKTKYAKSGDVHIAFQVLGDGERDLVFVPGAWSHVEWWWEEPAAARFFHRLASFSRLILFDKRGTGLSDQVTDAIAPTLEQRMDDVRAVMDAVGSKRAALFGISEGAAMSVLFAATYPERTSDLMLYAPIAKFSWGVDYPWGFTPEFLEAFEKGVEAGWGEGVSLPLLSPRMADDTRFREWWGKHERLGASPGAVVALVRMDMEIDVRPVLSAIRVPTLILHRVGDPFVPIDVGRYMAEQIPAARFVSLPGDDHIFCVGDTDTISDEIEEFVTGARQEREPDRVLATVLFTDVVGSTERAASLGDRRWRDLLESYYASVRREVSRLGGREVDTAGDGFLASFDGPARAIKCAVAIRTAVAAVGISIRAGLHTGEVELMGEKVGGIAVHIGARVASMASPGEVLVSSTVKDLVAGSGIRFTERGTHVLKGVPGEWRLFAAE